MTFLATFDLKTPADYGAAHAAMEQSGFRRVYSFGGSTAMALPDSTYIRDGGFGTDIIVAVQSVLQEAGLHPTRIAASRGEVTAWEEGINGSRQTF